jgi:tetratricopeptide (TPR) repeat protein
VYLWSRTGGPEPPGADLSVKDPAVARAVEVGRAAVRRSPRSGKAWGELGMVFAAHDYFAQAAVCFAEAERLEPRELPWAYYHGLVLRELDPGAALPQLRRAVEVAADQADTPRARLAEALLEQGLFNEAYDHFLRLLRRNPDHLRAHLGMGRLVYERGDLDGSLFHLRRSVASPSARRASHTLLARIYQRQGNAAAAAQELRQVEALPEDPSWPDPLLEPLQAAAVGRPARLKRVGQLVGQDRVAEAEGVLRDLVREEPDCVQGWLWLGHVGLQQNKLSQAEQAFRSALEQFPDSAEAHFMLGLTRMRLRQPARAEASFRRAVALKPADGLAHFELGRSLLATGDRAGAVQALRTAVRCKPQLGEAHLLLAEALVEEGRLAEALVPVRDALALNAEPERARKLLVRVLARVSVPGL